MSPLKLFHKYRGLTDFTLPSLLRTARELIPRMVGKQTRYKVTDLPSERTVRYYLARGLMDRPLGKRGTVSLFGYRHLLQLLAIKYLQYQYLPLEKIRTVLAGRSNREIEGILPETLPGDRRPAATVVTGIGQEKPAAGRGLKSAGARDSLEGGRPWRRYPIAPGVELHLCDEYLLHLGEEEIEDWGRRILGILRGRMGNRTEGS